MEEEEESESSPSFSASRGPSFQRVLENEPSENLSVSLHPRVDSTSEQLLLLPKKNLPARNGSLWREGKSEADGSQVSDRALEKSGEVGWIRMRFTPFLSFPFLPSVRNLSESKAKRGRYDANPFLSPREGSKR